jgi:SAM-dependent methyltransferase
MKRRTRTRDERAAQRGSAPIPKPPLMFVLHDDINPEPGPQPIYGQYPRGFIESMLPWLRCARREVLHVCSGALPRGEGIRVDIRPEAMPDFISDGRALPFADGSIAGAMCDPPYCEEYAQSLYGVEYPRPSHLLTEVARVVRPGGRIVFVHYIVPQPVPGTRVVAIRGMSTGFNMPMRAVSIYERDQAELALGVG